MSKFLRILAITLLSAVVLLVGALHLVLHTGLHNRIIAGITSDITDGEIRVGDIGLDLGNWPEISISLDSVSLTFPHELFARYSRLTDPGRGAQRDTLAVLGSLRVHTDFRELRQKRLSGNVEIDGLGAYLLNYSDDISNLDIFHFSSGEKSDSSSLPYISATLSLGPSRLAYLNRPSDLLIQGGVELEARALMDGTKNAITVDLDASRLTMRSEQMRIFLEDLCLVAQVDDSPQKQMQQPPMPRMSDPRLKKLTIPEFLREESFKEADVDVHLDEKLTSMLNKWHPAASLELKKGLLLTSAVPLENSVEDLRLDMNMNALHIDTVTVYSGSSDLALKGTVTGLAHTLFGKGRGVWRADLDLKSERLNVNEFLAALDISAEKKLPSVSDSLSDAEFYEAVAIDTLEDCKTLSKPRLIVVPANVIADLSLKALHVDFDQFDIEPLSADISLKERCIRISKLTASSNKGDIRSLDAYYFTKSKENIGAGFDVDIEDVTADNIRAMFPKMGEKAPALQTFTGNARCIAAATLQLDTNMTVLLPTMKGTLQFHADSLSVPELGEWRKYARMLMFRNLSDVSVHDIDISGTISSGKIEVYPFLLGVDRYGFAFTGEHQLDSDFSYRGTIIKSPLIIRAGARAFRKEQSRVKVRLSMPQFRSLEAVPTFYREVDSLHTQIGRSVRGQSGITNRDFIRRIAMAKAKKQYKYKEEDLPEEQQKLSFRMEKAADPPENRVSMLKKIMLKWKKSK